jgi:hypothetical protein
MQNEVGGCIRGKITSAHIRGKQADQNNDMKWVKAHTWQSWREHYKKGQAQFDPIIEEYVEADPPRDDGKGQFRYRRESLRAPARRMNSDKSQESKLNMTGKSSFEMMLLAKLAEAESPSYSWRLVFPR